MYIKKWEATRADFLWNGRQYQELMGSNLSTPEKSYGKKYTWKRTIANISRTRQEWRNVAQFWLQLRRTVSNIFPEVCVICVRMWAFRMRRKWQTRWTGIADARDSENRTRKSLITPIGYDILLIISIKQNTHNIRLVVETRLITSIISAIFIHSTFEPSHEHSVILIN